ncbi:VOC family protein [Halocatena pleomorpha]|uniref:VOC family protein n=1 Tax=Halocatena pleomorpha TaxID=1785090 RepID=A0A3P3RAG6_9EURY|nr:VOC family protein [Halocatena pleomorpha]RRJ30482.1 VOC family protein [Halocatena pleomorpha]
MVDSTDQSTESDISPEPPDSLIHTAGTDHITLVGSNEAETIAFYRDVLGMSLVLRQPNLDAPDVTHLFFDTGDGRMLTFFVTDQRDSHEGPQRPPVGGVHHLAFRLEPERFLEARTSLTEEGYQVNEFDRGAFHSLYTRDHNGLTIELTTEPYRIPDDRRGEVLATAHRIRTEEGAQNVETDHIESALTELGIPIKQYGHPQAESGEEISND